MKCGDEHEAEEKRRNGPGQKADGDKEPAHQFEGSDVVRPEHAGLESRRRHPFRRAGNIPAPPAEELLASMRNEPQAERHAENRVSETLTALVQRTESREYVSRSLLGCLHDGSPSFKDSFLWKRIGKRLTLRELCERPREIGLVL